jgi:hypothetical protein
MNRGVTNRAGSCVKTVIVGIQVQIVEIVHNYSVVIVSLNTLLGVLKVALRVMGAEYAFLHLHGLVDITAVDARVAFHTFNPM